MPTKKNEIMKETFKDLFSGLGTSPCTYMLEDSLLSCFNFLVYCMFDVLVTMIDEFVLVAMLDTFAYVCSCCRTSWVCL